MSSRVRRRIFAQLLFYFIPRSVSLRFFLHPFRFQLSILQYASNVHLLPRLAYKNEENFRPSLLYTSIYANNKSLPFLLSPFASSQQIDDATRAYSIFYYIYMRMYGYGRYLYLLYQCTFVLSLLLLPATLLFFYFLSYVYTYNTRARSHLGD